MKCGHVDLPSMEWRLGSEHWLVVDLRRRFRMHQIANFAHLGDKHKDPIHKRLNDELGAQITYEHGRLKKLGHGGTSTSTGGNLRWS